MNNNDNNIDKRFQQLLSDTPSEEQVFISKTFEIANQVISILDKHNLQQKELAFRLGKTEAEISRWLSGFHNFTIRTLSKIEATLGETIICTPTELTRDAVNNNTYIVSSLNNDTQVYDVFSLSHLHSTVKTNTVETAELDDYKFPSDELLVA